MQFVRGGISMPASKKIKKRVKKTVKAGKEAVRMVAFTAVAMAEYPLAMMFVNKDDD